MSTSDMMCCDDCECSIELEISDIEHVLQLLPTKGIWADHAEQIVSGVGSTLGCFGICVLKGRLVDLIGVTCKDFTPKG